MAQPIKTVHIAAEHQLLLLLFTLLNLVIVLVFLVDITALQQINVNFVILIAKNALDHQIQNV